MSHTTLTVRQKQVLWFIKEFLVQHGTAPTIRQIGTAVGIKSPNGVMSHLKALVKKGAIRTVGASGGTHYLPAVEAGCCPSCGQPIEEQR